MFHSNKITSTVEAQRMEEAKNKTKPWRRWGPYLSERQWGTIREDYSADGSYWDYLPHDHARSRAYRWGEEGIAGISDYEQNLCFSLALWNEKDEMLKERLFGLTGNEGNHGEDVKEYYFYLSNTPSHSYMKYLYKYPQEEYPYAKLVLENKKKRDLPNRGGMEYELLETGVFDENRYFDVFIEYAKKDAEDILIKINVKNHGDKPSKIWVLPTLWFRNIWSWEDDDDIVKPNLSLKSGTTDQQRPLKPKNPSSDQHKVEAIWGKDRKMWFYSQNSSTVLFTENETNSQKLFNKPNLTPYVKDSINDYIVHNMDKAVKATNGTKASAVYYLEVQPLKTETIRLRLTNIELNNSAFDNTFEDIFEKREKEMNDFYDCLCHPSISLDLKEIQKQAFSGMLWSKQFYYYDVKQWLKGDKQNPNPPKERSKTRNKEWQHFVAADVFSMPDKWEYPWFAAWDLAFHAIPFSIIDPEFAKQQLHMLTRECYMHPNGQLPAYEGNFSDVNPPVSAWAALKIYNIEKNIYGNTDIDFLKRMFNKLLLYFTWWVNKKDENSNNIFEGGFLGLDNISVIDRSHPEIQGLSIEQADGTAWMGMFCMNMLQISVELSKTDKTYQDWINKFLQHYFMITDAMNSIGVDKSGLWDDQDNFYYDKWQIEGKEGPLRVRSMVGLIPLYAIEIIDIDVLKPSPPHNFSDIEDNKDLRNQIIWLLKRRKLNKKGQKVSICTVHDKKEEIIGDLEFDLNSAKSIVFSFVDEKRLRLILKTVLDETEFLSPYGIRSLSKIYQNPFSIIYKNENFSIDYNPAESKNNMFGGNSNWRGPVWFPVNFLFIESLFKFHRWLGNDFQIEYPTGSGVLKNLKEIAIDLSKRMTKIFEKDKNNERPVYGTSTKFQKDPEWKDYILFYEYFHGDDGAGIGASHQTGWTGLVAKIIQDSWKY